MGIFAELQSEGLSYYDLLLKQGKISTFPNDLYQTNHRDDKDNDYIDMIKRAFKLNANLKPIKIDMIQQTNLMYDSTGRFISILNRDEETGKGYQEYYGRHEFRENYKKYMNAPEKMVCFSTLYSKYKDANGAVRTVANIDRTSIFIQDLDAGKRGMSLLEQLKRIADLVRKRFIEMPHIFLFTGTGIQLVWLIDRLVMKAGTKVSDTWHGIQKAMFKVLEEAGLEPDPAVLNPVHNTRLVDSLNIHSAGGEKVRGYAVRTDRIRLGAFINKYFTQLHDVYKKNAPKKAGGGGKVIKSPKFWTERSYAWGMIQDMMIIPKWKHLNGESIIGLQWRWRMATIVRFNSLLYSGGDTNFALSQVEEWWNSLAREQQQDASLKEMVRRSRTAERYYKEKMEGTWDKKKYKRGGLFYTNKTLIKELELSIDCQLHLNIIKSRIEGYKKDEEGNLKRIYNKEFERARKNKENREKGVKERDTYLEKAKQEGLQSETYLKVKELYEAGYKQVQIVKKLGISKGMVSRLVNRVKANT